MTNLEVIEERVQKKWWQEIDIEKSINLLPSENIENKKRGIILIGKFGVSGFVVLTNMRIIFLLQYYLSSPKLLYIPLNAISGMEFKNLGFLRGSQRAINLKYNNESIIFLITYFQRRNTGLGWPSETLDFYRLLKKKLPGQFPEFIHNEPEILTKYWDYYLIFPGIVIGSIIGLIVGGFIGGLLGIILFGATGNIAGKIINKFSK
jgi:hypothetical protein